MSFKSLEVTGQSGTPRVESELTHGGRGGSVKTFQQRVFVSNLSVHIIDQAL